jgi:hypothetical protein
MNVLKTAALLSRAQLTRLDRTPTSIALYTDLQAAPPDVSADGDTGEGDAGNEERVGVPARGRASVSGDTDGSRRQRVARLSVLAESLVGVALLVVAHAARADDGPFRSPSGWIGWLGAVSGCLGVWLVPGGWLSAILLRAGSGPVGSVVNRIGALLVWYSGVGIAVHQAAHAVHPTARIVLWVTVAATAAVCLGVAIGLAPPPARPWTRAALAAGAGAVCAQAVIWLPLRYWLPPAGYLQLRHLDLLVVLGCAVLAVVGQAWRPAPEASDSVRVGPVVVALAAVATTAAVTAAAAAAWPTAQRLPSGIAAEQVSAPAGADVALAVSGTGPRGADVVRGASFVMLDDEGLPVPAHTRLTTDGGIAGRATLLVSLDATDRAGLCASDRAPGVPVKVTLREQGSGMVTQATLPARWCAR